VSVPGSTGESYKDHFSNFDFSNFKLHACRLSGNGDSDLHCFNHLNDELSPYGVELLVEMPRLAQEERRYFCLHVAERSVPFTDG
jgi:hypothetical protein